MKRVLSLLLAILMTLSTLSVCAVTVGAEGETATKYEDRNTWTASSPSLPEQSWNDASAVLDDNLESGWMTQNFTQLTEAGYSHIKKHELIITFPDIRTVSALDLKQRSADGNGRLGQIDVCVSATADQDDFVAVLNNVTFSDYENDISTRKVELGANIAARRIKILVDVGQWQRAALDDLQVYGEDTTLAAKTVLDYCLYQGDMSVVANDEYYGDAATVLDNNTATSWMTNSSGKLTDFTAHSLTVTFKNSTVVSALRLTPRQSAYDDGQIDGYMKTFDVQASNTESDDDFVTLARVTSATPNKFDDVLVSFGVNIAVRRIRIVCGTSTYSKASLAEFNAYGYNSALPDATMKDYNFLDRTGWTATASSMKGEIGNNLFDNNLTTIWHSNYYADNTKDPHPHALTVTLNELSTISGIRLIPREDRTGRILKADLYVSDTDDGAFHLFQKGLTLADDTSAKRISFGVNLAVKRIKLVVTAGVSGYTTLAEFDAYAEDTDLPTKAVSDYPLDRSGWTAEASSVNGTLGNNLFDGDQSTVWHSKIYTENEQTVVYSDPMPHELTVTLDRVTTVSGVCLTPRTSNDTGLILRADLYVSDADDGEFVLLKEDLVFARNFDAKEISFGMNLDVKRIKIVSTDGVGGFSILSEFDILGENPDYPIATVDAIPDIIYRGAQVSTDIKDETTEKFNIRFVATVNLLSYEKAGFIVTETNSGRTWTTATTNVYEALNAKTDLGDVGIITAADLGGQYIVALTIQNVPADCNLEFTVTPYVIKPDDTDKTLGTPHTVTITAEGEVTHG